MKTAKAVLEADQKATNEVQQNLETLTTNKAFMQKITQDTNDHLSLLSY